jgi:hypothetical protein
MQVQAAKGKVGGEQRGGKIGQRSQVALSKTEVAEHRIIETGKAIGAEYDPQTRRFVVPRGAAAWIGGKIEGAGNTVADTLGVGDSGRRSTARTQATAAESTVLAAGGQRTHETDEEAKSLLGTNDPRAFAVRANQLLDEGDEFKNAVKNVATMNPSDKDDEDEDK